MDVQILGISANDSFSQKTFADSLKLPYPLLSDHPDLKIIRNYGVLSPDGSKARRSFFLIDKQGIIRARWLVDNKEVFPSETILKAVREIRDKP
ncbi:MAG: peroxiredoxin family protein [Deltaproteobacteria bacterium]|nr:peroxiredoxin family protein [Deltaproteobacteria bacterium]